MSLLRMNRSMGGQGLGCLGSPRQEQAVQEEPGWPFRRDDKGIGATPWSSPFRSTITFTVSRMHAPAAVSGRSPPTNLQPGEAKPRSTVRQ